MINCNVIVQTLWRVIIYHHDHFKLGFKQHKKHILFMWELPYVLNGSNLYSIVHNDSNEVETFI